ncbi:hypothetical protein CHUAL_004562 [Chamberlinius hualienensis]
MIMLNLFATFVLINCGEIDGANETKRGLGPLIIGGYPTCLTDPYDTYCEIDRSYPEHQIDDAFKTSSYYQDPIVFLDQRAKTNETFKTNITFDDSGNLSIRTLIENTAVSTCPIRTKKISPRVVQSSTKSTWVYVINTPTLTQIFDSHICNFEVKSDCGDNLPSTYKTKCEQGYTHANFLAIDPSTNKTYEDQFRFPSHCDCPSPTSDIFFRQHNRE